MNQPISVECPTCGAPVEWGPQSPSRPFCCERCKLIDLGAWAAEEHAIAGDNLQDEHLYDNLPPSREH